LVFKKLTSLNCNFDYRIPLELLLLAAATCCSMHVLFSFFCICTRRYLLQKPAANFDFIFRKLKAPWRS